MISYINSVCMKLPSFIKLSRPMVYKNYIFIASVKLVEMKL